MRDDKRKYRHELPEEDLARHQFRQSASPAKKWLWLAGLVIVAGASYLAYQRFHQHESIQTIRIVAVTPIYTAVKIPSQECHTLTTSKMVKNKDSNFFNSLFNSKAHPKYIKQSSSKQVCGTVYQESQVSNGYVVHYQFGEYIESISLGADKIPPAVNTVLPLSSLQNFQRLESMTPVSAETGNGQNGQ